VIEIAKVLCQMGGIHISHMRDEASLLLDNVRETIRIGEEGRLPTQITHHKAIGYIGGKSIAGPDARCRNTDPLGDGHSTNPGTIIYRAPAFPTPGTGAPS
jgi:hypothetical protein